MKVQTLRRFTQRIVVTAVALASLHGACSAADVPTPTASGLMKIAFPDWKPNPHPRRNDLPASITRHFPLVPDERSPKYKFTIAPLVVASLDNSHAVLLASGTVDLGSNCDYSCTYAIGAYFFTAGARGWALSKSIHVVSEDLASFPPYHTKVVRWPGYGVIASFWLNNNAQGDSADEVYLLRLTPGHATELFHTSIAEDNDGAAGLSSLDGSEDIPCGYALNPKLQAPAAANLSADQKCYHSDGSWTLRGNTIVFEFHGVVRATDDNGKLRPLQTWHKRAVVMPKKGGGLKLISGDLPVYTVS